jgi:hypothetical protein
MLTFIKNEKTWLISHLVWVVAVAVALVIGHVALSEHDARVKAEASIKASEATVASLQQQIATTNAQAAQKVTVITKVVHDLGPAPTTGQIVAAIPQLTDAPLNARTIPGDPTNISVAAFPLIQVLQQAATDHVNLGACQSDLKNETAISAQKDAQIAILKKKSPFLTRLKHGAELVGVGLALGLLLK